MRGATGWRRACTGTAKTRRVISCDCAASRARCAGLQRMVEGDKYCIDILTQVSAVTRALQSVALGLFDEHLSHCVAEAVAEGGDAAEAKVREASDAIARLVRS